MTSVALPAFPDAEMALLWVLGQAFPLPAIRFTTVVPAGDLTGTVVRIHRISGADRGHFVDHPIVDVDVFDSDHGNASNTARDIQAFLLSCKSEQVLAGKAVIVNVLTINAPRRLPEANPNIVRMNATYELRIHAQ